jgi:glucose/arabinose dehydrogenase
VLHDRSATYLLALAALGFCLSSCTAATPAPEPPTPAVSSAPATQTVQPATPPQAEAPVEPALAVLPTVTPDPSPTVQSAPTAVGVQATQSTPPGAAAAPPPLPFAVTLPPGFQIHYYARNLLNARSLALGANGTVFVGSRSAGNVYALVDDNGDQQADRVITVASGLNSPNGVAFQDGALYVAEIQRIIRFDNLEARLENPPAPVVINQDYPADAWHGWKYLRFGLDGFLYTPVGAPCNVCEPGGLYGTITRLRPDGSGLEVYARGIRNTVGFDWHPQTQELWFTDNGHDDLGDDIPPDELNHAPQPGLHFGFPYCHGGDIPDPQFGQHRSCAEFTPPAIALGPHVAALGMRFYTGAMFPAEYQNQIFIAEHGSASRSIPIGYRLTLVRLVDGQAASYETFAEGWLQNSQVLGRPVDLLVLPDGSLLISDDTANAVYRISYQAPTDSY